jgi:hypothetical protein
MFAHRLVANGIGGKTVSELNEIMDVDEFLRWVAYFEMFPQGNEDLQFARLNQTIISTVQKSVPPLKRFMLGKNNKQLTADETAERMDGLVNIL